MKIVILDLLNRRFSRENRFENLDFQKDGNFVFRVFPFFEGSAK